MAFGLPSLSLGSRAAGALDDDELDPDDLLEDGSYSTGNPFASRKKSWAPSAAEAESILDGLIAGAMSGVQWVGETLDKSLGGRTVRAIIDDGVQASDFAHLIPFSDSLGLTARGGPLSGPGGAASLADKDQVPGGQELLKDAGLSSGNPWIDIPAGVVAEAALDPATYLVGPGKAIVGGAAKAMKAGKTLGRTPIGMVDEIARGERGLFGLRVPFTDATLAIGTGPTAAKVAEKVAYSGPVRGVRALFDSRTGPNRNAGIFDRAGQIEADKMLEMEEGLKDFSFRIAGQLENRHEELKSLWDGQLKSIIDGNPDVQRALGGEGQVGKSMELDDFLRGAQELRKTETLAQMMQRIRGNVPGAVADFDNITTGTLAMIDDAALRVRELGGNLGELADEYAGYSPRRLAAHLRKLMPGKSANNAAGGMWSSIQRSIRHVPGGTNGVNHIAMDADVVGSIADGRNTVDTLAQFLENRYGVPKTVDAVGPNGIILNKNGTPKQIKVSEKLAKSFGVMPKEVLEEGLFTRGTVNDMTDYLLTLGHAEAGLSSFHRYVAKTAEQGTEGVSVASLFKDMGIRQPGWNRFRAAKGVAPGTGNLRDWVIPSSAADIAKNYLRYNGSPKETTGLLKAYDKMLSLWKGAMYTVWPASHVRDALSGLSTNMLSTFKDPANGAAAMAETTKVLFGGNSEYLRSALRYGLGDKTNLTEMTGGIASSGLQMGAPTLRKSADLVGDAWGNKFTNPLSDRSPYNPFNLRGVREGNKEGSKFLPAAMGEQASATIDFANKFSGFVALKLQGWSDAAAAHAVKLSHYDYSKLSAFERDKMKRLIPFYSYARFNLVGQIRHLADYPGGRHAQALRLVRETNEAGADDRSQYVPQYLRKGTVLPIGKPQPDGKRTFFTSTNINPIEEAFNRLAITNGKVDWQRTLMNVATMTTAPVLAAGQIISGKQFYTGREINDLAQTPFKEEPTLNMLMRLLPTGRAQGFAEMWNQRSDRATLAQKLINSAVGGQRVSTVDVPKWMAIDVQKALEEKLRPRGGIGEFSRLYAQDADQLDEDTLRELAFLNWLRNEQRAKKASSAPASSPGR